MFVTWMLAATFWAAGGEPESSPFPGESPSPISSLTLRLTTAKIERTDEEGIQCCEFSWKQQKNSGYLEHLLRCAKRVAISPSFQQSWSEWRAAEGKDVTTVQQQTADLLA